MNYIKYSTEENFKHWEIMKRAKLGDKAFLEKYIRTLPKLDMFLKILLPISIIGQLYCIVMSIIEQGYLLMVGWIVATSPCGYWSYVYYFYLSGLHKRKVEEWKKELEEINKNTLCASV